MLYDSFQSILEAQKCNGEPCVRMEAVTKIKERTNGKHFSLPEHVEALVYALLRNQRPWKGILENRAKINGIFHNFDIEFLELADPNTLVERLKEIKCGNRAIVKQMNALHSNIEMLERISKEYGSMDTFIGTDTPLNIAKQLSNGSYKLKQVGIPLAIEYLQNVGIDAVNPDAHTLRILGYLGYVTGDEATATEAIRVLHEIALKYGRYDMEVSAMLRRFFADRYAEICLKNPRCPNCRLQKRKTL